MCITVYVVIVLEAGPHEEDASVVAGVFELIVFIERSATRIW